jgi:hypothetical protein
MVAHCDCAPVLFAVVLILSEIILNRLLMVVKIYWFVVLKESGSI